MPQRKWKKKHKMKRLVLTLLVISFVASFEPLNPVSAQGNDPTQGEIDSGSVVCPPGIYTQDPLGCLPLGPSSTLTQGSVYGVFPPTPRLDYNPDYALNYVPYNYFRVNDTGTTSYLSLGDAESKSGALSKIGPGLVYVSYIDRADTGDGVYYFLANGTWIPGDGGRVSPGIFQGKEFGSTPRTGFGWFLTEAKSKRRPDFASGNYSVRNYYRFNFVPVYASKVFNVDNGRWIEINLAEQTLSAYDNNQLVYSTLISSGVDPYWTRPGLFQIYKKKDTENMSGSFEADRSDFYSLQDVPWTMYFDKARAIHGAYWHTFFGYPMSHGCVNMSIGDSAWLYQWAKEGDWVWVHDPSGLTPEDPDLYGSGAP
jgi:hypothetical protein